MSSSQSSFRWMRSAVFFLAFPIYSFQSPVPASECQQLAADGPMQVTLDCIDPTYNSPMILSETDETSPVPHRRVHGQFNGTTFDFNIYLPEKAKWDSKFFQLSYPTQTSTAEDYIIAFAANSSGYAVQARGTIGYRVDAAVAKFSRQVARQYYQKDASSPIHGYLYGGSGGSFTTVGAMENTFNVWDGAVVMIQAVPISNPNNWCIRALGGFALAQDKAKIADAVSPGGSIDLSSSLSETSNSALDEVTALGVPLRAWEDFDSVGRNKTSPGGTSLLDVLRLLAVPQIRAADPTYADDFWSKPGYLGTEKSPLGDMFRGALVAVNATVQQVAKDGAGTPVEITLDKLPPSAGNEGIEFSVLSEQGIVGRLTGTVDIDAKKLSIQAGNDAAVLAALAQNTQIQIDNRWHLSVHGYHRHQVPDRSFYGYDYLRNSNGEPRYPQRKVLFAPSLAKSTSGGGTHTGKITGKMILMDNLLDFDAFPWHADWYKSRVQQALGARFKDNFRLHYNDNADHGLEGPPKEQMGRLVDFRGNYQQHLRDLAAWVEHGTAPPEGTNYSVKDGQVIVPSTAASRKGIQSVVDLSIDGESSVKVSVGQSVTFTVHASVPPNTGSIVSLEWDFKGTGDFVKQDGVKVGTEVQVQMSHTYDAAAEYFPAVRVASQRTGAQDTPFARVLNLGRARVTVG